MLTASFNLITTVPLPASVWSGGMLLSMLGVGAVILESTKPGGSIGAVQG